MLNQVARARANVDRAISELNAAYARGWISDADYIEQDAELRTAQKSIAGNPTGPFRPLGLSAKSRLALGWKRRRPRRSPDREKSRERARMLGGAGAMPPDVRRSYTDCERAALYIVAAEVKRRGICDLSVGEIAARAGVCRRTVQNAVAEAIRQGHLAREERPGRGRKNLTNVLRILSKEWLAWIKRGPIGCKVWGATENIGLTKRGSAMTSRKAAPRVGRILRVSG